MRAIRVAPGAAASSAAGLVLVGLGIFMAGGPCSAARAATIETDRVGPARFGAQVSRLADGSLGTWYVLQGPVTGAPALPGGGDGIGDGLLSPGLWAPTATALADTLWTDRVAQQAIPEQVAINGDGSQILAGWWLNHVRVSHYATHSGRAPTWTRGVNSLGVLPADTDRDGSLFTTTGTLDSLFGFDAAGDTLFDVRYAPFYSGGLAATCDSGNVVVRTSTRGDTTLIEGRNAATGDSLWARKVRGEITGLDISSDGHVVALTRESGLLVCNGTTGAVRDSFPLAGGTPWPPAISGDGSVLVVGGYTPFVRVYEWDGADYVLRWQYDTGATFVTSVEISDDASTVAAGTFLNTEVTAGALYLFDAASPTPLWSLTQFGDMVSSVSLSGHGEYGVAGCWGRRGSTFGYLLVVFRREFWFPLEYAMEDDQILGIGSMMDVEMADDGTYCVAGARSGHARLLGNGGVVLALSAPGETSVKGHPVAGRAGYILYANRPNPANPATVIPYRAPDQGGPVDLALFDVAGRRVRQLVTGRQQSGWQEALWDGRDEAGRELPSGVYFARLSGAGFTASQKVLLAR